jgi:hypothetical protein
MNSGQSHKLAVGSTVIQYTTAAVAKHSHAVMVFNLEKVFSCIIRLQFYRCKGMKRIKGSQKYFLTFV